LKETLALLQAKGEIRVRVRVMVRVRVRIGKETLALLQAKGEKGDISQKDRLGLQPLASQP
jgi:hypothetical protein